MPQIIFVNADGTRTEANATSGESLMRVAHENGVSGITAECGGCLSCATCHTYIAEPWFGKLQEASEDEKVMVECAIDVRPTSRLSCQVIVTDDLDGMEVEIPESQY